MEFRFKILGAMSGKNLPFYGHGSGRVNEHIHLQRHLRSPSTTHQLQQSIEHIPSFITAMPSIVTIKEEKVESDSTPRKTLDEKHEVKLEESSSDLNPSIYEETDECDLQHSNHHVWLVKLPAFIRENWNPILSNSEEEVVLGRVMVNKKDASVREPTFLYRKRVARN
jgi:hypothetical protein